MNLMQLPDEQNSKRQVSDENQEKMEKIFLEKPDWKKKEKHHQTGKTKDSSLVSVFFQIKFHCNPAHRSLLMVNSPSHGIFSWKEAWRSLIDCHKDTRKERHAIPRSCPSVSRLVLRLILGDDSLLGIQSLISFSLQTIIVWDYWERSFGQQRNPPRHCS